MGKEILDRIKKVEIKCPDCEDHHGDDQYTCTTCWCEGGGGYINIYDWLKENPNTLNKQEK